MNHECSEPIDKPNSGKNSQPPDLLGGVRGQIFKLATTKLDSVVNTFNIDFTRKTINMKREFNMKA